MLIALGGKEGERKSPGRLWKKAMFSRASEGARKHKQKILSPGPARRFLPGKGLLRGAKTVFN